MNKLYWIWLAVAIGCALAPACGDDDDSGKDAGTDSDTDTDSDSDTDTDTDSDTDTDTDSDTDGDCTPVDSATLDHGDAIALTVDISAGSNQITLSCEEEPGGADQVIALSLAQPGDLVVTTTSGVHIFAVFPAGPSAAECPESTSEYGCFDPFYDGMYLVYPDLPAGDALLVVSEFAPDAAAAHDFSVAFYPADGEICNNGASDDSDEDVDCDDADCADVAYCLDEICDNGIDDNLNGVVDCLETPCIGTAECTGGDCAPDLDLGVLTPLTEYPVSFDTTTDGADNLALPCATVTDVVEYVIGLTVDLEARLSMDLTQAAELDHALGFFVEGGEGSTCVDWTIECYDAIVQSVEGAYLNGGAPLAPGTYYVILEVNNNAGPVDLVFTAEPDCEEGYVWDDVDQQCEPWECTTVDLGTWDGTPINEAGDSCTGTKLFGNSETNCTGYPAGGEELIYSLVVPDGETIDVTMTPDTENAQDSALYLLAECLDFSRETCLAGVDETLGGEAETLSYTNDSGDVQTVYVYADAYSGCGAITLDIE